MKSERNKNIREAILLPIRILKKISLAVVISALIYSCGNKSTKEENTSSIKLPVISLENQSQTIVKEYPASVHAKSSIQIRPQVEGILEKIYVDEGQKVVKGELLFKINDRPFIERLNQASANLEVAKSALIKSEQEVSKKQSLVDNKVITDFQLKNAISDREIAKANLRQAKAQEENARISLSYTQIRANKDGVVGRLETKEGSLVGPSDNQELTTLSDNNILQVYFAFSESDFISLKRSANNVSIEKIIDNLPPVKLILSDQTVYDQPGKIDMVDGQFKANTGSIMLRATFPNPTGFLREGNTGKLQIPSVYDGVIVVPQESIMETQGKIFVFKVGEDNKVHQQEIQILGKNQNLLIVKSGLQDGDRIVAKGTESLKEDQVIIPVKE